MKDLNGYLDSNGLPVHRPNYPDSSTVDGGDSLNRLGHIYFCRYLNSLIEGKPIEVRYSLSDKFIRDLNFYKYSTGKFIRYPDPRWEYREDGTWNWLKEMLKNKEGQVKWACGRDQIKPIINTCKLMSLADELAEIQKAMESRWGRYQNFDINWFEPEQIGDWAYYTQAKILVNHLNNTIDESEDGNALNYIQSLILQKIQNPSPWIGKSIKYCHENWHGWIPKEAMALNLNTTSIFHFTLAWYFRHDSAPPIDELYFPLIDKYLT